MIGISPIKQKPVVQQLEISNYLLKIYQIKSIHNQQNFDFEENSPHQEGIITETYESPDKSYLEQSQELSDLVDSSKLIHKYLPKQVDID